VALGPAIGGFIATRSYTVAFIGAMVAWSRTASYYPSWRKKPYYKEDSLANARLLKSLGVLSI